MTSASTKRVEHVRAQRCSIGVLELHCQDYSLQVTAAAFSRLGHNASCSSVVWIYTPPAAVPQCPSKYEQHKEANADGETPGRRPVHQGISLVRYLHTYTGAVLVDNRIYRLASQHSRRCKMQQGPHLRSTGISCLYGACNTLHQQAMVLSRLSSCTMPLHWFPVIPLPENVFPDTVLPTVHLPLLQNNQIAAPALSVKVLPEMLRPKVGPKLFCVFNPGTPSMLF